MLEAKFAPSIMKHLFKCAQGHLEVQPSMSVKIKIYPNLGHSPGEASSLIDDRFRPMNLQPIQDVADWLEGQIK